MRGQRWIGVGAVAIGMIVIVGCAELALIAPALQIDAAAVRRTSARSGELGERESWSWGIGASVSGAIDAPPARVASERVGPLVEATFLGRPTASPLPCREPALCLWERRARAEALLRATEIATTSMGIAQQGAP